MILQTDAEDEETKNEPQRAQRRPSPATRNRFFSVALAPQEAR
jgi:hypothetical protein